MHRSQAQSQDRTTDTGTSSKTAHTAVLTLRWALGAGRSQGLVKEAHKLRSGCCVSQRSHMW